MTVMAKKSKGNQIQRRNVTPTVPNLHNNGNAQATKNIPASKNPALQNSYTYTMAGMLLGALVGYFLLGNLNLGFGIGILIGGVVDVFLNSKKKKKREALEKENAEKKA
jgi:hypothetical protein